MKILNKKNSLLLTLLAVCVVSACRLATKKSDSNGNTSSEKSKVVTGTDTLAALPIAPQKGACLLIDKKTGTISSICVSKVTKEECDKRLKSSKNAEDFQVFYAYEKNCKAARDEYLASRK